MKKKQKSNSDVFALISQIQGQLATLDQKLDSFMTKSLNELAQALAASKTAVRQQQVQHTHTQSNVQTIQKQYPQRRQMYAVVCYECGKDTELPFKPSGNRPVYCKECFAQRKNRSATVNRVKPSFAAPSVGSIQQQSSLVSSTEKTKKKRAASKSAKTKKKAAKKKPAAKKKSAVKKKPATKKKSAVKKKTTKKKPAPKKKTAKRKTKKK